MNEKRNNDSDQEDEFVWPFSVKIPTLDTVLKVMMIVALVGSCLVGVVIGILLDQGITQALILPRYCQCQVCPNTTSEKSDITFPNNFDLGDLG